MKNAKQIFHYISYLQYPIMLAALYFSFRPLLTNLVTMWVDYNKALMFMGIAISFSTLQDTQKTQNQISKRVFENPKYANLFLVAICVQILVSISFGIFGFFISDNAAIKEVAFGLILFGMGLIGMLKSAVEMAENHRK
jgi:hypothetical protein